jgi:predicted metal-dependent enzyme (double-stranded beta helix superfamily)
MADRLEQFAEECNRILTKEPGPSGREKVVAALEGVLEDKEFVSTYLGEGTGSRDVLYEDPDLGFTILAHAYEGASQSNPHDHGPAWAIYGQASGETEMTEWDVVEPATPEKAGKVRRAKSYVLKPGMACLYNEGQLHSPRRESSTKLIRIEGQNMDRVKRLRFEAVD